MSDKVLVDMGNGQVVEFESAAQAESYFSGLQSPEVVSKDRNWPGRARAAAQGATFALADEAEAGLRSVFTGREYSDVLDEVRKGLDEYRKESPGEALAFEVAGVTAPVAASIILSKGAATPAVLAASAKTGKLVPWLVKTIKAGGLGAVEGGVYSFNAGEGGAAKRFMGVPLGSAMGAVGGAGGYAAVTGAGAGFKRLIDHSQRKFGPRMASIVEREFRKVADDAGVSVDDLVRQIDEGRLPVEISGNETLMRAARGYRDQSRAAGKIMEDAYDGRASQLRTDMIDMLRKELAGTNDPNVIRSITTELDDLRKQAGASYQPIFDAAPPLSDDIAADLADIIKRSPQGSKMAAMLHRAETGSTKPFWSVDKRGNVKFSRPPTLRDAEIIRRGLSDATSSQFRSGSGGVGAAYGSLESGLRQSLDDFSPDLAAARQKYAVAKGAREAFDTGSTALSKNPDEIAMLLERYAGKPEDLAAFRAGVAAASRRRNFQAGGRSLPRKFLDEDSNEGAILRLVFPEDKLDDFLDVADKANTAITAENTLFRGSQTSANQGASRQSNREAAVGLAEGVMNQGMTRTLIDKGFDALKRSAPQLTDDQLQSLARLMVESDPAAFRAALQGGNVAQGLTKLVDQKIETLLPSLMQVSRRTTGGTFNPQSNVAAQYTARGLLD